MARRVVVCYSQFPSHALNLGRIPELLHAEGWKVFCLNKFGADEQPIERVPGIEYEFGVPQRALAELEADLYLSPLVGQRENFPRGARRVHFLVSLTSLEGVYDPEHFDHYDAIVCAGNHHVAEFDALGSSRGWSGKRLLPIGYPKLDGQRRLLAASGLAPAGDVPTVVFAPTHAYYINEQFSVLGQHGEEIVSRLLDQGMRVVFRPHMVSWKDQDRHTVEQIVLRHSGNPLFEVDRSGNYFETYARADVMLTDISGTGFTFAFTFGRPAVYFAPDAASEEGKSGIQFDDRDKIGFVARTLDDVEALIDRAVAESGEWQERIDAYRDGLLFNVGTSEEAFAGLAGTLVREPLPTGDNPAGIVTSWAADRGRLLVVAEGAEDSRDELGAALLGVDLDRCHVVALDPVAAEHTVLDGATFAGLLPKVLEQFKPTLIVAVGPSAEVPGAVTTTRADLLAALRAWTASVAPGDPGELFLRLQACAARDLPLLARERAPRVSVVMPAYNAQEFIAEAVESVLSQTMPDLELVVLDDGSTDATLSVLSRYTADPRVRVLSQGNLGRNGRIDLPFNRLVREARGEFVAWMGGDDACLPDRLEVQLAAFDEDPGLDVCHGATESIDDRGNTLGTVWRLRRPYDELSMARELALRNIVCAPSVMLRSSVYRSFGVWEDGLVCDYQYWLRAAGALRFRYLPQRLIRYRKHDAGLSTGQLSRLQPEATRIRRAGVLPRTLADFYPELVDDDAATRFEAGASLGARLLPVDPTLALHLYELAEEADPGRPDSEHNRAVALLAGGDRAAAEPLLRAAAAHSAPSAGLLAQLTRGDSPDELFVFQPENRLTAALSAARRRYTGDARRWDGLALNTVRATLVLDPRAADVAAAAVREWCERTAAHSRVHWSFPTLGRRQEDVLALVAAVSQGEPIEEAAPMTLDVVDELFLVPSGDDDLRGGLGTQAEAAAFSRWLAQHAA
jgi:GT2 family glycosyltransferase/CDP-glycerol glycerophosphotransferase (TagB/SpsB family)